jgi:hypothetical protein
MKQLSRDGTGQFKKGTSGNPAGRPAGSRNKATLLCEQLLAGDAGELMAKVLEMAKKDDFRALQFCLERILPVPKERCINLELRPVSSAQNLPMQYQDIVSAIGNGTITPSEGESLSNILVSHARSMEQVEFEQRITELERITEEIRSSDGDPKSFIDNNSSKWEHEREEKERQERQEQRQKEINR